VPVRMVVDEVAMAMQMLMLMNMLVRVLMFMALGFERLLVCGHRFSRGVQCRSSAAARGSNFPQVRRNGSSLNALEEDLSRKTFRGRLFEEDFSTRSFPGRPFEEGLSRRTFRGRRRGGWAGPGERHESIAFEAPGQNGLQPQQSSCRES
jgi:hypothetical protein